MSRLENFLDEQNRLTAFPAKRRVKLQALCYLAQKFEPGKIYTEKQVNVLLNQWHTFEDPATLRRELYQHRFLGRQPSGAAGTAAAHTGGTAKEIRITAAGGNIGDEFIGKGAAREASGAGG